MEYITGETYGLQNKRSNETNHKLTIRLLAATREYYNQQYST